MVVAGFTARQRLNLSNESSCWEDGGCEREAEREGEIEKYWRAKNEGCRKERKEEQEERKKVDMKKKQPDRDNFEIETKVDTMRRVLPEKEQEKKKKQRGRMKRKQENTYNAEREIKEKTKNTKNGERSI